MIRLAWFGIVGFALLGCSPTPPKPATPARVSWVQIVHDYRDFPDRADAAYRGREVQVHLPATDYRVLPGRVEAFFALPGKPGALVFECSPPTGPRPTLLISGTCKGMVRDGIERANGIQFFVLVTDCRLTETRP